LYNYLSKNNVSGQDYTYSQYLFGTNNIEQLKQASSQNGGPSTFGTIQTGKQFFVVMGITSEVSTKYWVASAAVGTVIGSVIALTPVGWVVGAGIVATSIGGGIAGATYAEGVVPIISGIVLKGKGVDNNFLRPTVVEAESDRFKALNCEEILTYS